MDIPPLQVGLSVCENPDNRLFVPLQTSFTHSLDCKRADSSLQSSNRAEDLKPCLKSWI